MDIANKYLIKIGEYFQNNGHRATPYADFFNFMVKVAIEGQLDITSFSSWKDFLLTATGKQLQNRVVDALIGVVINMLCPTEKETCRYAKLIFRIAHFGNSIRAIALDFFEASLPLMKYYILNKGSMSVDGLCINICYGLYESGHAITNSTSLKDGDIRKRDLKEDMKLAYSTDPKYQEKRKDTFGSEETALTFYNDNNSKLLIDRLVDQKAFQKFRDYVIQPTKWYLKFTWKDKLVPSLNGISMIPKVLDFTLGNTSYYTELALRKLAGYKMPKKKDKSGNDTEDFSDSYSNLKDLIFRRTLGEQGLQLENRKDNLLNNVDDYITKKNTGYLEHYYKDAHGNLGEKEQEAIREIEIRGQQKARDNSAREGFMNNEHSKAWWKEYQADRYHKENTGESGKFNEEDMKEFYKKEVKPKYNEMEETLGKMKGLLSNGVMSEEELNRIINDDTKDKTTRKAAQYIKNNRKNLLGNVRTKKYIEDSFQETKDFRDTKKKDKYFKEQGWLTARQKNLQQTQRLGQEKVETVHQQKEEASDKLKKAQEKLQNLQTLQSYMNLDDHPYDSSDLDQAKIEVGYLKDELKQTEKNLENLKSVPVESLRNSNVVKSIGDSKLVKRIGDSNLVKSIGDNK